MKKIIVISAVMLFSVMSFAGYSSASEGRLGIKSNADVSISSQNKSEHSLFRDLKEKVKNFRLGTVTAINADGSFTVQNKKASATATVKTDASTTYTKNGQTADKSAVTVGTLVNVKGAFDKASSTISATVVHVLDQFKSMHIKGTVTAMSGATLTLKADNGTVYTVDATKAHIFRSFWFGTSADIKVGDTIGVWGSQIDGSAVITARIIRDASANPSATPSPTPVH